MNVENFPISDRLFREVVEASCQCDEIFLIRDLAEYTGYSQKSVYYAVRLCLYLGIFSGRKAPARNPANGHLYLMWHLWVN